MKNRIIQIAAGAALLLAAALTPSGPLKLALFAAAYLTTGWNVLWQALKNLFRAAVFDENLLMSVATLGAFFSAQYAEGVAVMLFYQLGELFQSLAVDKSRKSVARLMDIRPDHANLQKDGVLVSVAPDELTAGDIIVIKPGERIPVDAVVTEGASAVDASALTGESLPREVSAGSELLSGCINLSGVLTAAVKREYAQSTVSRILDTVERAAAKKSKSERFITKFARVYTPAVVAAAVLIAAVPPLFFRQDFGVWLYRALIFLVVSCPCALVISIPLSFFGGIGGASRKGILIKGANHLEALAEAEIVVFDKTGTLTKGVFEVRRVIADGISETELLELAAHAESFSTHPISESIKKAYGGTLSPERVTEVRELAGHGVLAKVDGIEVLAGNASLMEKMGVRYDENTTPDGAAVYIAVGGKFAGAIIISDTVKEDAAQSINRLRADAKQIVMLTGDSPSAAQNVAGELGIERVYSQLLPHEKVDRLEELLLSKSKRGKLVFVGDGINDAPVLARADIGVAMGALGSEAAIEAADIVIMTDELSKLPDAVSISKRTLRIAGQNIALALGVKLSVLALGVFGLTTMWAAIFADVGVTVLAVLNSFRALSVPDYSPKPKAAK